MLPERAIAAGEPGIAVGEPAVAAGEPGIAADNGLMPVNAASYQPKTLLGCRGSGGSALRTRCETHLSAYGPIHIPSAEG